MSSKANNFYIIYIGTTKLVALSAIIDDNNEIIINKFVECLPFGFKEGIVANIEKASQEIKKLVFDLLGKDDFAKYDFHIVFSNKYIKNFVCNSSIYFGEMMKSINRLDIERVISQTRSVATVPLDENIIEDIPKSFIVNDLSGIIDPLELEARRLGVELRLFTINNAIYRNIVKVLERIDIIPDIYLPNTLVSSYSVLRKEERSDGIIMINIGGNVTGVVYWRNNTICHYETLPIGGEYITEELASNLNISLNEARRLKERFGSVTLVPSFEDEIIPVVDIFGNTRLNLSKKRLYDHIFVSSKMMLEELKPIINKITDEVGVVTGLVFTGGAVALDGILELAEDMFNFPLRLGVSRKISGPKEFITSPKYTALTGILAYIAEKKEKDKMRFKNKNLLTKKIEQVKEWIQNYF